MRAILVTLVVLMAVIVPSQTFATEYRITTARAIELDAEQITFDGNAGSFDSNRVAAMFRGLAQDTKYVKVTVSGSRFESVAASQDRVAESGRYKKSSQKLVERGKMVAPTEQYAITIWADQSTRNDGALLNSIASLLGRGSDTMIDVSRTMARVKITLEPLDIRSGLTGRIITAEANSSDLTNLDFGSGDWSKYMRYGQSEDTELKVLETALAKAAMKLFSKLDKPTEEVISRIGLTSNRQIRIGDEIVFYRNGKAVASYEILANKGHTLTVRILYQKSRPKAGDTFKVG